MAAKFEETRVYKKEHERLVQGCEIALEDSNFKIKHVDYAQGVILAKAGFSMWSWSEEIIVRISVQGAVTIRSECVLPTQIVAWGKNKRNAKKFFRKLEKLLATSR